MRPLSLSHSRVHLTLSPALVPQPFAASLSFPLFAFLSRVISETLALSLLLLPLLLRATHTSPRDSCLSHSLL